MREFNHHMAGNNLEASNRVIDQELRANPNNAEANYLKGNLLYRQENFSEGNEHFERSLNTSSRFREHITYLQERNYRDELENGIEAFEADNDSRAVRHLARAAEIAPDRHELYPVLGRAHENLGQVSSAEEAYDTCLSLDSDHQKCGLNLAELYYEEERYESVIPLGNRLSAAYPEDWRPLKLLTESHLELGEFEQAETSLERMRSLRNDYNTLKNSAIHFYNNGETERAEHYLRECLVMQPRDADVLKALTEIYLNSRNYDLVIEAGERLLGVEPNNRTVKAQMMIAYEITGDIDRYNELQQELGLTGESN